MQLEAAYPVVVTDRIGACRDFYARVLEFSVAFEATWFVYLTTAAGPYGIAFMAPDHPSRPPGPEAFAGEGVLLTLQVEDAASEFERLRQLGVRVDHPLTDEAWGQRRFGLRDPAGVWVDVVEQIQPEAGFWERYATSPPG